MSPLSFTSSQARQFLLAHQSLWPPRRLQGKAGTLAFIRRVNCIQFDPLDMAGQNADLVLQARVRDFTPAMLRELLYTDRQLLDGWDKLMSIWPVEDWPYFARKRAYAQSQLRSSETVQAVAPQVRAAIETRGPLSSLEIDLNQNVDWYWAPTRLSRAALESLYFAGELVVHHKVHTRKVYDLSERHIPPHLVQAPEPNPTEEEYHDWYVLRRLGSVGLLWNRAGEAWLGTPLKSPQRLASLRRLQARGAIQEVQVEGLSAPLYLRTQEQALVDSAAGTDVSLPQVAFLAPLDNLLWDRRLLKELFGFEYRWEVYKPARERQYGYYVLPVLYGDRFVARFEPVRAKKSGVLTIKNWWWEPDVRPDDALLCAIGECFEHFCAYLGTPRVQLDGYTAEVGEMVGLAGRLASKGSLE